MESLEIVNEFLKRNATSKKRKEIVEKYGEDMLAYSIIACIATDVLSDSQQVELKYVKDYVDLYKFSALIKGVVADIQEPRVILSFMILLREVKEVHEQIKSSSPDLSALLSIVDMYDFVLSISEGLAAESSTLVDSGCAGMLSLYKSTDLDQMNFMMCVAAVLVKFADMDILLVLRDVIRSEARIKSMPEILSLGMMISKADSIRVSVGSAEYGQIALSSKEAQKRAETLAASFLEIVHGSIAGAFFGKRDDDARKEDRKEDRKDVEIKDGDLEDEDIVITTQEPTIVVNKTMSDLKNNIQ